ncbi:beta-ketoacyl-ACP synthase 3 [Streptomyces sp. YIM 98790]|uniref:beta-ketoacyl-ACP synthase 3 n=1 Tax=Streptomyces sp. YIM 98790 TaxID=2689077 RepID=UPI00140BBD74|nr:beta-ketoacyl-ACP synthase 3 [Streptomyces sp. YIM 98790]
MRAAVLTGVGSHLPPRRVGNGELTERMGTSDEWVFSRSGIRFRHVVDPGVTTGDLAVAAGRAALRSAGTERVASVVLATMSPDRPCPATAPRVAAALGCAGAAAMDVHAVCAGFVYGLGVAQGLIAAGTADSALVIGADVMSPFLDPEDPGVCLLFGDGAGAVVLRAGDPGEPGALGPTVLAADGRGRDLATVRGGGCEDAVRASGGPLDRFLRLEGREVFRRAVEDMSAVSLEALKAAGWKPDEVDRLVAHQANARILAMLGERLDVGAERLPSNIEQVGNTCAASIPLLLDQEHRAGGLAPGHRVVLTGFGAGLASGATTVVWPELHHAPAF